MAYSRYQTWVDNTGQQANAAFLNAVEDALVKLFGVAPATNGAMIWDGTKFTAAAKIANAQVDAAAAIDYSKLNVPTNAIAALKTTPVRETTTVAGLGTAADGALGRLRLGTTPYDFIDLVYDATYAKWVSAEIPIMGVYSITTTSLAYTAWGNGNGAATDRLLLLKLPVAAGLTLQARMVGVLSNNTGGDGCTMDLFTQTINVGGDYNASTTVGGAFTQTVTGTTRALKDSGWANVTYDSAAIDYVLIEPVFKAVTGGTAAILIGQCTARWVG